MNLAYMTLHGQRKYHNFNTVLRNMQILDWLAIFWNNADYGAPLSGLPNPKLGCVYDRLDYEHPLICHQSIYIDSSKNCKQLNPLTGPPPLPPKYLWHPTC